MANQTISQLPSAGAITGTELVPIVQNGVTVQTTTGAIAASPSQTQTFLTLNNEPTLNNSRFLSTDANLSLTDGGAQSFLRINLTGAAASLNSSGNGFQVKTGLTTVVPRLITTATSGISIANGDGVSGNPTISLTGQVLSLANASGAGLVALPNNGTVTPRSIVGTASEIDVADGDGAAGNPTVGLADNPVLPGIEGVVVPSGNTGDRPVVPTNGTLRYNSQTATFEGYANNAWGSITTGTGVTSVDASGGTTGFTFSGGPITTAGVLTMSGTLNVANGGTGANTLTGYVKGSGTSAFTASATIPGADISGNISGNAANVTGTVLVANGGTGATTLTGYVKGNGTSTMTASATIPNTDVTGLGTMSTQNAGSVAITGGTINGTTLGATTPAAATFTSVAMTSGTITTAPTTGNDIVNKTYADSIASGINFHESCAYATTAALPTVTYNNGTSGVGATLTATANGALVIDGHTFVSPADDNKRVLIKNQANTAHNGVYTVTQVGDGSNPFILTRATDFDSAGTGVDQINQGDFFLITGGTANGNTSWVQQTPLPITVGTTGIVFTQFGAPLTYSAGTGLTESPSYTFNIATTGVVSGSYGSASSVAAIAVNAQGQITSATDTSIAISASQVTSGSFGVDRGAVGITSYSVGDLIYANTTTSFDKLAIGAASRILTSTGSAPSWTDPSTITVGTATNATNATNVGVAVDSTNANYFLGIYSANTGNLPTKVATGLTANPSTGMMTGGISGGTF